MKQKNACETIRQATPIHKTTTSSDSNVCEILYPIACEILNCDLPLCNGVRQNINGERTSSHAV
jgi:hypothetical protein